MQTQGLETDSGHTTAKRLLNDFGSLISFDIKGNAKTADRFCKAVKINRHATSLGGVESTMERRAAVPGQTHLPETLLRLCVGIENVDDLKNDIDHALTEVSSDS